MNYPFDDAKALFELINLNLAAYGGGMTGEFLLNTYYCKHSRVRDISVFDAHQSQFFRPLRKKELDRIITPFTAPFALSIIAVELALACTIKLLRALVAIVSLDGEALAANLFSAVRCLAFTVVLVVAAVISPVVNLIDLFGATYNALTTTDDSEDTDEPRFNFNSSIYF